MYMIMSRIQFNYTALVLAAGNGHVECVRLLVAADADLDDKGGAVRGMA